MYGKHFQSMYTGSMYGAGATVFAVWGYCISHANGDDHSVELNSHMLSNMIGASVEDIEKAIAFLCSEDTRSRTVEHSGKRLIHEGGFQYLVVNHGKYRNIRSDEERRAYNRDKKRAERARNKEKQDMSLTVNEMSKTDSVYDSDSDSSSTKGIVKGKYGEFSKVELTEEEYNKLIAKHTQPTADRAIEVLDGWLASTGKRRKNHYACLKEGSWVWERMKQMNPEPKKRFNPSSVL